MERSSTLAPALIVLVALSGACGGEGGGEDAGGQASAPAASPLMNPRSQEMTRTAPDTFRARVETTEGAFVVEVVRAWAPNGADRFYNLVSSGFYDGARFFRVIDGFVAQFGIHADPQVSARWREARIPDDPVVASNTRGTITFATSGANSRTTQVFLNFVDNSRLDEIGFSPFGSVVEGMGVVDSIYSGYGDSPSQPQIQAQGDAYLAAEFPELDRIERATLVGG